MISFLNFIALFFRLTLAIQSQVGIVANLSFSEEQFTCQSTPTSHTVVHTDSSGWNGNVGFNREIENEERTEVEGEGNPEAIPTFSYLVIPREVTTFLNPFFGNKPIRGSLPPLYVFFQSWKIHLS